MTTTVNDDTARTHLLDLLDGITADDALESEHRERARAWVASGAELYRREAIDVPPIHLVVYFLPVDPDSQQLLLVAHRRAGLWLPAGGHVEPGETPWTTVTRECTEELHLPATTSPVTGTKPLFLTVTRTHRGLPHTDVSLWYLLRATPEQVTSYDDGEFTTIRWWPLVGLREHLGTPAADDFEPHLARFLHKLNRLTPA